MLQARSDYEIALLLLMENLPRWQGVGKMIQDQFEKIYHDQIPREDFHNLESGISRWRKEVQWSRYQLVKKGLMDAPQTGIWRLTQGGHQWLSDHASAATLIKKTFQPIDINVKPSPSTLKGVEQDSFLDLQESLSEVLPPKLGDVNIDFVRRSNYLQIRLTDYSGCHYEIILRRDRKFEIALHFESSAERSQARLSGFEQYLDDITKRLGMSVHAGNFQNRGWTQIYIESQISPLSRESIKELSELAVQFMVATFPILQEIYAKDMKSHRHSINNENLLDTSPLHKILDKEVETIQAYLHGRSSLQLSDEKLCDWINFCYTFEMYSEGRDLFALVNGAEVNPWYFERTKRIVKVCDQKANLLKARNG